MAILICWVSAVAEALYRQHQGQGYVTLFLSEKEGISVWWVEKKERIANKALFQAGGYTVLSLDELVDIAAKMAEDWASGDWVKVVDWMNRYGKSSGLDFSKILET